jgi:hypothetical protein
MPVDPQPGDKIESLNVQWDGEEWVPIREGEMGVRLEALNVQWNGTEWVPIRTDDVQVGDKIEALNIQWDGSDWVPIRTDDLQVGDKIEGLNIQWNGSDWVPIRGETTPTSGGLDPTWLANQQRNSGSTPPPDDDVAPPGYPGIDGDYTTPTDTRFNGLPGEPLLWENTDTGKFYMVYEVPGQEPPIPLLFEVPDGKDLQSFFGQGIDVKIDGQYSTQQIESFGAIPFGSTDTIPEKEGDPWAGFVVRMTRAVEVQPWLEDDEVWATFGGAWLEGRAVEDWELQATDYWQGLNDGERQWITLSASDPSEADRVAADNRTLVAELYRRSGVEGVADNVVDYMANQFTTGKWSKAYLQEQVWLTTGSPSNEIVDSGFRDFMTESEAAIPSAVHMDSDVKNMFDTWLGPQFAPTDTQVKDWAARMRRNPDATRDELTEHLRTQRLALFPQYEDPSLTYEDIAGSWRNFMSGMWGQTVDEMDPLFLDVVKLNDAAEAGKLLRKEGLERNIGAVQQSVLKGIGTQSQRVVNPL